jgi:hypothetical protein
MLTGDLDEAALYGALNRLELLELKRMPDPGELQAHRANPFQHDLQAPPVQIAG